MGIPKFFKWLTRRYPLILRNIKKEEDCPPTDNLYLDLNGIVHNCIHGNDSKKHERVSQLSDFEEVWAAIMLAIDELVHTVKPKKLLFLAVDGVAPRAKMNQQRARRFRSAKDAMALRDTFVSQGKDAPELFDSNAISPGTEFMFELNKQLAFFVQYKLNTDPLYQKLEVVLSDGAVPGEGEHKMMDYIRQLKLEDNYDPNTRHCFYGADADLIMLSLITHEPHFTIIREEHIVRKVKQGGVQRLDHQRTSNFQVLFISLLREYFQLEYQEFEVKMKMKFNLERIIDDFAFFCFFIGNDFIPSLTTLDIGEGALDKLIDFYKKCLNDGYLNDYITNQGEINWDRAEIFIKLLGQHEHDTLIGRVDQIKHFRNEERLISFDQDYGNQHVKMDRKALIAQKIKSKIYAKKVKKVDQLTLKQGAKRYKKFLLIKKFEEDNNSGSQAIKDARTKSKQDTLSKYSLILQNQNQSESEAQKQKEEVKQGETLADILHSIKEEYFSDLAPQEIPDSDVSDVNEQDIDEEELSVGGSEAGQIEMDTKIEVQTKMADKYQEENYQFMVEFVKLYAEDENKAKAQYYSKKLKFDITIPEGEAQRQRMLKKYLEGLQWVLFYYYKGAQHWRWYYPFHYAPMISDLGTNISEKYLGGKKIITEFEIDTNCSEINYPYTPFQQLLSIMPSRSAKLMPTPYSAIIDGVLNQYFPLEFELDLNGRTLPWEAACLIPFCDEKLFLDTEEELLKTVQFDAHQIERNTINFTYYSFRYNSTKANVLPLNSTLTTLEGLEQNFVSRTIQQDYQNVGKYSFLPEINPKAILPCIDFPSLKWLNITTIEYDKVVINKVPFKRVLVKAPQLEEEASTEALEMFCNRFIKTSTREVYVDFPYQNEAFPVAFEDKDFVYNIMGDVYGGFFSIKREQQQATPDQFEGRKKRQLYQLNKQGIHVHEDYKILVTFAKITDASYNYNQNNLMKNYENDCTVLPFNVVMKKRDPNHYLNINPRIQNPIGALEVSKELICLKQNLYGIIGSLESKDLNTGKLKVSFNKELEESKIHDPFIGHNCLNNTNSQNENATLKKYVTDRVIENQMKLKYGVINKVTGSVLLQYTDRETFEKNVVDLGLNLKNFTKQVHIPDYVRYVQSEEVADYQHDNYNHNIHSHGAKHQKKYFEYSEECVKLLKEYYILFPEVFEFVTNDIRKTENSKNRYQNRALSTIRDILPELEPTEAVNKIKTITGWLEGLPLSKLPYVQMGFNALAHDLIQLLDKNQNIVKENYQTIKLKCKSHEFLMEYEVFQEQFPFWTSPYSTVKRPQDYQVGDRVINVNSSKREYVPFGLRGTVVGKTNDKVIVIFDEQFLQGNNIHGHCQNYKGGFIDPNHLINLTKKFASLLNKNLAQVVDQFIEQPPQQQQQFVPAAQPKHRTVTKQEEKKETKQYVAKVKQPVNNPQEEQVQQLLEQLISTGSLSQQEIKVEEQYNYPAQVHAQAHSHTHTAQTHQAANQEEQKTSEIGHQAHVEAHQQEEVIQYQEEVEEQEEEEFGFITTGQMLQQNPDFAQLMDLMQIAQQMKMPLPGAPTEENQESNLNANSSEFVPSWKKQ